MALPLPEPAKHRRSLARASHATIMGSGPGAVEGSAVCIEPSLGRRVLDWHGARYEWDAVVLDGGRWRRRVAAPASPHALAEACLKVSLFGSGAAVVSAAARRQAFGSGTPRVPENVPLAERAAEAALTHPYVEEERCRCCY